MLFLISLLSFLLPTQLSYHLSFLSTSVYGFRIDYLSPAIYLSDIVIFLIILKGLKKLIITKKTLWCILGLSIFIVVNLWNAELFLPSLYKWIKVIEIAVLGVVIYNTEKFNSFTHFVKPLSYSMLVICILGVLQFLNSGSINGLFYFLGERQFLFSDPNVAPYPYSTFSHPNSFAGFLLVFVIFLLQYKNKFNKKYFWILFALSLTNIVLTNSLNVYIVIFALLILGFRNSLTATFSFFDLSYIASQRFVTHRLELMEASVKMIKQNFWTGVGLNNFIPNLVKVSNTFVNSWELQPVHNIFLLVFTELGIIGFFGFIFLVFTGMTVTSYPLIAIVLTGMSDHYWLTLQQNMLLFMYVLVVIRKK